MATKNSATPANRLLARLSASDFALLERHLTPVDLPLRTRLEVPGKPIDYVYFPESGFASVVADGRSRRGIEVGLIGREGMTGLAIVMGSDRTLHETYMQSAGQGQRISAGKFRKALEQSGSLHQTFLLYGHAFVMQATYTAMANGRSKIEERLARWLLMAQDRINADRLTLTHEFLSLMLGVRRPGVTVAIKTLQNAGLVAANRGVITILDRKGLEQISNGAYGPPEAEFQRLLG